MAKNYTKDLREELAQHVFKKEHGRGLLAFPLEQTYADLTEKQREPFREDADEISRVFSTVAVSQLAECLDAFKEGARTVGKLGGKLPVEIKDWARDLRFLATALDTMHHHHGQIAADSGVNVVDARDVLEMAPSVLELETDYSNLLEAVAGWLEERAEQPKAEAKGGTF